MEDIVTTCSNAAMDHPCVGGIDGDNLPQAAHAGDSVPTRSACEQVFGTNELLEMILVQLPVRDIFVVQGVARSWQNAIAVCPSIQEKLFFRRGDKSLEVWALVNAKGKGVSSREGWNRDRHIEINNGFRLVNSAEHPLRPDHIVVAPVALNALFEPGFNPFCPMPNERLIRQYSGHAELGWTYSAHPTIFEQPCASLRDTYLSDPPCHQAYVMVSITYEEVQKPSNALENGAVAADDRVLASTSLIRVRTNDGIKVAHILDAALLGCARDSNIKVHDKRLSIEQYMTMPHVRNQVKTQLGWWKEPSQGLKIHLHVRLDLLAGMIPIVPTPRERENLIIAQGI